MNKNVLVVSDKTKDLVRAIDALTKQDVYVGIPSSKTERQEGQQITNAAIGYIQTNGAPENNLPARPFLAPGILAVKDKIASLFKKAGKNAIEGDVLAVEQGLNAVGLVAQVSAKNKITDGIPPPLKASTLAGRQARGRTGTTPLIDTGQLLNSITYVLRKR